MKCQPFFTRYTDTWILGLAASIDTREFRIGLGLVSCEIGLCFISEKPFDYGCSGCNAVGEGTPDQLPPGWEKRERRDGTHYFLCPNCIKEGRKLRDDYVITDDNREQAVAEIVSLIVGEEVDEAKALWDYANRLIEESLPESWGKKELEAAVAAYSDGLRDASKYFKQKKG